MPEITMQELQKSVMEKGIEQTVNELVDARVEEEEKQQDEFDSAQKVVILTALQKAIKQQLDEQRGIVEDEMRAGYAFNGSDRRTAKLSGSKIGSISLVKSKDSYFINDRKAFEDYIIENNLGVVKMNFNIAYSTELYTMLEHLAQEGGKIEERSFKHMFESEIVLSKDFDKNLEYIDDVCMNGLTGEVIPGIEPHPSYVKGIRVLTEKTPKIWRALTIKSKDTIGRLLGAGE